MRKKSHISLAKYIVNCSGMEMLGEHRKAFYIGSILPDCRPSFITQKHCIEDTFGILKKEIQKITEDYDQEKGIGMYYCRHLGVITHYIADYFTFPHNSVYEGNIKEHCRYEKKLKFVFKQYVQSEGAKLDREESGAFEDVNDICRFIKDMHEEYLKAIRVIKVDCLYIVSLCHAVVDAILKFFEFTFSSKASIPAVL